MLATREAAQKALEISKRHFEEAMSARTRADMQHIYQFLAAVVPTLPNVEEAAAAARGSGRGRGADAPPPAA